MSTEASNIVVKLAEVKDKQGILDIISMVHKKHCGNEPSIFKPCDRKDLDLEYLNEEDYGTPCFTFVAKLDNKIVGIVCISLQIIPETLIMYEKHKCHIDCIGVLEEYQGKGIGKALINKVIEFAKQEKFDYIDLGVWSFNKQAQEFYKHCGFEEKFSKMGIVI